MEIVQVIKQLAMGYHLEEKDVVQAIKELKLLVDRLEYRLKIDYKKNG